jgi:phosphatidylglycerol lysyltransferase
MPARGDLVDRREQPAVTASSIYGRLRQALPAIAGLVLFLVALEVLRSQLRALTWRELTTAITAMPLQALAAAGVLTAINYAVLTAYDLIAFAYIGKRLSHRRIAAASFVAYAIANSVGFAMLSGGSVRYRFYTRWGVTAEELARIVFSYMTTFWVGLLLVGGISLAASPPEWAASMARGLPAAPIGWLLILIAIGYVAACAMRWTPIRVAQFAIDLPSPGIAIAQLGISSLDWVLAGAVLYALLPIGSVTFLTFLAAFLAAQLLGLASHVPGGLGVFEGLMIVLLRDAVPSATLAPALLMYRVVYYLCPLAIALLVLVGDELRQRRHQAARLGVTFGWLAEQLTPRVLAIFTFFSGVVLLLSGATPSAPGRLGWLMRVFPLGIIEVSHFAGSVIGATLLLLSQGLARRLDAAFYLTSAALSLGIAASLLKGADYEEALILAALLAILWRARPAFDRRAALFDTRFPVFWTAGVAGALGASIWLALFSFKHVEYSSQLWWQFEARGEASRMLRAEVGAAMTLLCFAFARLLGHAPHEAPAPTDEQLAEAAGAIDAQTSTVPYLVYLRDKAILFDESRSGFVMYGVQGRTWVALGDPVGPEDRQASLIRAFLERCDDFGGVPVFYEISGAHLDRYVDLGLTFVKLCEEARINLLGFSLDGGHARKFRQALRRLEREHATFRVIGRECVPAVMSQLREVSDDWLRERAGSEKGFSLGCFKPDYVARFPVAVVEREGRIVAFATLWPGPQQTELSVDLMRFDHRAPRDVMEALFVHVMLWGRAQGYKQFSMGMAPLSGFESSPVAPLWNRIAAFLYRHGDMVYSFQGLRAYKEKFDPVWQPRYLAYPGGLRLPLILADVSALVAGGYRKIFLN